MPQIQVKAKVQRIAAINANKAVGRPVRYSTIKESELLSYAAQSSNVPEATILASSLAIKEAIIYFVLNGHHVNLDKFGFLGARIKAYAVKDAEEVASTKVKSLGISYRPSTEIKELVSRLNIQTVTE